MSMTDPHSGNPQPQEEWREPDLFDPPPASHPASVAASEPAEPAAPALPDLLRRDMPLVPPDSAAGRALVTVIAILAFLAALTAGAAALVARASSDWRAGVVREMTIQVRPAAQRDIDKDVAAAAAIARDAPGIADVQVFSKAQAERLLEPWLGKGLSLDELPIPRLIVLKLDAGPRPDYAKLRADLAAKVPNASLDDHQGWVARLSAMADTLVVIGFGLVALVLTAAALAVAFATRGAMAGNRDIIEVLHFVGADDRFVAREFQVRFLRLGLKGGAIGSGSALLLIVFLGWLAASLRASPSGDQITALFGAFSIGWDGYAAVILIAGAVAAVTAIVSRMTVRRHLARLY